MVTTDAMMWGSFVDCLRARARTQPDRLAYFEVERLTTARPPLSYAALDRRVRAVAARLQASGGRGQRVLLVIGNTLDYLVGFLACAYADCVAVNLLPPSRPKHLHRLAHVARDCAARTILTSGPGADAVRARLADIPSLGALRSIRVDTVPDEAADDYRAMTPDPASLCYLQYTSGSTGAPRGVMISHRNLMAQHRSLEQLFGFGPDDRSLSWLPLYHDLGLIVGILQALYTGFPGALSDPLSFVKHPRRWLEAISEHGITFTGGPNFGFDLCVEAADGAAPLDLSRWTRALNGSEPIRARTLDRFDEAFAPAGWRPQTMHPAYGLAEFTLVATAKRPGTLPVQRLVDAAALEAGRVSPAMPGRRSLRLVSSGRAGPGTSLAIVDPEAGARVTEGRVGEIWLTGASMAMGYYHRPEETAATFGARLPRDPRCWLRTGDLGFVDDGELYVTGRLKDVIIVNGANRYPQDIEETVERADPAVRPHFVAAFADDRGDRERLSIVAEIRRDAAQVFDGPAVIERIVRAVAREHDLRVDAVHLAHHGQVPMTTSGKIRRGRCRLLIAGREMKLHASLAAG